MRRLLRRLWCRVAFHSFAWEFHPDRPSALVCRRCGHREERGMEWVLKELLRCLGRRG